jgi:hypothetical protein
MQLKLIGDGSYKVKSSDAAILPKTVRIEWGSEFVKGWTIPNTGSPVSTNAIAILHSPISGAILVFTFGNSTNPVGNDGTLSLSGSSSSQPIAIIVRNGQMGFKGAALCIDSGSSSTAVRMAIPADSSYDFNTNVATYTPDTAKLRSLCSI